MEPPHKVLDHLFLNSLERLDFPKPRSTTKLSDLNLSKESVISLWQSQLLSRHLDFLARDLKDQGVGFYTIASSGHEGNACFAKALNWETGILGAV